MPERLPVFLPTGSVAVPRPPGLHRATYRRLIREYNRLLTKLADLPRRRLWPHLRKAYQRQFENRILRIRRALHLPTSQPRAKPWYRTTEAALYLGISAKTLVRWTDQGIVRCHRAGFGTHRHYAAAELARVRRRIEI
jgi:excisionase family DNA binding protein